MGNKPNVVEFAVITSRNQNSPSNPQPPMTLMSGSPSIGDGNTYNAKDINLHVVFSKLVRHLKKDFRNRVEKKTEWNDIFEAIDKRDMVIICNDCVKQVVLTFFSPQCDQTFTQYSSLQKHARVHDK